MFVCPRRNSSGFTLVELLVVIMVISTLAFLLLPVLRRNSDCGGRSNCASNLKQIVTACLAYAIDHQEMLPTQGTVADPFADQAPLSALNLLYPRYVNDMRIFWCASVNPLPAALRQPAVMLSPQTCNYVYDPGRSAVQGDWVVLADQKGNPHKARQHDIPGGLNVARVCGSVEQISPPAVTIRDEEAFQDPDIYARNQELPRKKDCYLRQ